MTIPAEVQSAVINSRVLRTGEEKGQTRYSLNIQLSNDQTFVASTFALSCDSEAQAKELLGKYQRGTQVSLRFVPREVQYINLDDISLRSK